MARLDLFASIYSYHLIPRRGNSNPRQQSCARLGTFEGRSTARRRKSRLDPSLTPVSCSSRFQKIELRCAERKSKEDKDHMKYLRQLAKEEREKREAIEKEIEGRSDNVTKLKVEKEAVIRERDELVEQVRIPV